MVAATQNALTRRSVGSVMWQVNLALVPGVLTSLYYFPGYLLNLVIAVTAGVALEVIALRVRGRNWQTGIADGSVVLTGLLVALAAPPGISAIALLTAMAFAVLLTKHSFGGIGRNLFNPAMVGYAAALICFPAAFASWPVPVDGVTTATVLDAIKTLDGLTMADRALPQYGFGRWGGHGTEMIGIAFAAGGIIICWLKLAAWRVVGGFLLALLLCTTLGYDNGSSTTGGSPAQHLLGGGTLLAAFFVLTDPVTHPSRPSAQWLFGALIAALTYTIRSVGAYPDGIAFAVLLANGANPLLNQWAEHAEQRKASKPR